MLYGALAMATTSPTGPSSPTSAGALLAAIRDGTAVTRADLARHFGLARSTVAQRVDALLAAGLAYEAGGSTSTGGRPPTVLAFNESAGIVLVADLGATHARVAVSDLAGTPLAETTADTDIALGPEAVLGWTSDCFSKLLKESGHAAADVRAIGIGVPGPVEFSSGRPVNPPIMPGWDDYSIPGWFADRYEGRPVIVDNDVNIMARGEHWIHWRDTEHLLLVKVGTGIGCGIVAAGQIHHGARGAAGDIGHIRVTAEDVVCTCGNVGCLEAVAGGQALAKRLAAEGADTANSRDVVRLVRAGDATAMRMVRDAGRSLGEVLAGTVNFFNPEVIVIGGDIAESQAQLIAGVREGIFSRSLALATRDLRIVPCQLGDRAGVMGAAIMAIDRVLAPEAIDQALRPT
jgi:predicted NBD/HSP70 family sugar kinase